MKHGYEGIHPGFETWGRCHQTHDMMLSLGFIYIEEKFLMEDMSVQLCSHRRKTKANIFFDLCRLFFDLYLPVL